jgi:hypothetical protein
MPLAILISLLSVHFQAGSLPFTTLFGVLQFMFNLKLLSRSVATITSAIAISAVSTTSAQAITLHTTDFIPDATRTNFNGFEGIPGTSYGSVYAEDGIQVEQVDGNANGIWTSYLDWGGEGQRAWYPNGGDFGFTKITRQGGGDFFNIGLLRGSGYGTTAPITYVYQLLNNGSTVLSGNLFSTSPGYIGFSGGDFDELRLGAYYGNNPDQTLSGIQALAIDSIELSGSSVEAVPTPALLPGLVGLSMAAWRKRRESQGQEAAEKA